MSYRSLFMVCYDIRDPHRLRCVHRYLLGYKVGGQKSFYECWLTPSELTEVYQTMARLIEPTEDRVHIFQLDPRMKIECYGVAKTKVLYAPFIVV